MVDFVPWLVALALIGVLTGEAALLNRPRWWRGLFRLAWGACAAWTILFNVCVSLQHNDLLRAHNPELFARFAVVDVRGDTEVIGWVEGRRLPE